MWPAARRAIVDRIEDLGVLDAVAAPLQSAVHAAVPLGSAAKDLLSGTWLGHPLHPPLTDLVVGSWTAALALDLADEEAADLLVALGCAAAVPTAAAGLSDWAELRGGARRVGTVHALGNTTALVLHALSLAARRGGDRSRGRALSGCGFAVAGFSAWLGGHLSFGAGVGVDQTVFVDGPDEWTRVLGDEELPEDEPVGVRADGAGVLLVRRGGRVHAIADRCSHRGCPLHEGELRGDEIVCACHGSTFRLDGSLVRGPATAPQPRFAARLRDGAVEVRREG